MLLIVCYNSWHLIIQLSTMEVKLSVEAFLNAFKTKLGIWGILIKSDRQKNLQTIADLEIRETDVVDILFKLTVEDYSEGPLFDIVYGGADMWVFGKQVKGHEIYIKITLGVPSSQTICISFHFAKHPMAYPFKKH